MKLKKVFKTLRPCPRCGCMPMIEAKKAYVAEIEGIEVYRFISIQCSNVECTRCISTTNDKAGEGLARLVEAWGSDE